MKPAIVSEQDLALFLSGDSSRRKKSRLMQMFSSRSLEKALVDKGRKPVNMEWVAKKLIGIVNSADKDSDRIAALDRLREIIFLGAIQDTHFRESLRNRKGKAEKLDDPFCGEETLAQKNFKLRRRA